MSPLDDVLGNLTGATLWTGSWLQGIILTYYLCKFWKLRKETVYIKRRGHIATAYTISIIIVFIFGYPLRYLLHWEWKEPLVPHWSIPYTILTILNDLMFAPFYYSSTFLTILRYWLIYYDIKFSTSCLNLEWKQCIKSDIDSTDHNETKMEKWCIEHRKNYGNQSFLLKRIMIISSIISILSMTFAWIYEFGVTTLELWLVLNIPIYLICGSLILYISKKMPEFNDKIYLHKEGKLLSLMWIFATSFYALVSLFEIFVGRTIISFFLSELASMIGLFSMSFVSTYWVMKQVEVSNILNNLEMVIADASQLEIGSVTSRTKKGDRITLQMILCDKDLFGLYMQHLIKEFSMECLLAVVEFTQFKKHAIDTFFKKHAIDTSFSNININVDDFENSDYYNTDHLFVFPENVPLSDIVYGYGTEDLSIDITVEPPTNSNSETDKTLLLLFKDKAHKLYHKYIAVGSGFEVNISYKMRAELTKLLGQYHQCINNDELKERELINIFNECIDEMIQLLQDSKSRFLAQNTFELTRSKTLSPQGDQDLF